MAEVSVVSSVIASIKKNKVGSETQKMAVIDITDKLGSDLYLVHFNISGQKFAVSDELVRKFPESKLASPHLLNDHWVEDLKSFYFDRDPALFNSVLNILRYNVLNVPSGYDKDLVMEEINFWQIPTDGVKGIHDDEESRLEAEFQWLENRIPPPPPNSSKFMKLRYKWWCFITDPLGPHTEYQRLSVMYAITSIMVLVLYVLCQALGTSAYYRERKDGQVRSLNATYFSNYEMALAKIGCIGISRIECYIQTEPVGKIDDIKQTCMILLIIETILRLILCTGWKHFKSVLTWLDIAAGVCASATFVVRQAIPEDQPVSTLRKVYFFLAVAECIQVLRLLKIFQYASLIDGLMIMTLTIKASLKELLLLALYLIIAMLFFATLIAFAELDIQTGVGVYDTIYGYWWAIITMTTVGYGDYYPTSIAGYFVGVLCAISGLILTALPVAIIGSKFNEYWEHNRKRRQLLAVVTAHGKESYN